MIFVIPKIGWGNFFIILGLLLSLVALLTTLIYEKGVALFFGIVLILVGLWLRTLTNKRRARNGDPARLIRR